MPEPKSYPSTPEPVSLAHGGELTITAHEGEYVLHITRDGTTFRQALSARDVQGIREMTGGLTLEHLRRVEMADAAFARLLDRETGTG